MTRRFSVTTVVRTGLALEALGLLLTAIAISPNVTFLALLPGLCFFGLGVGFASSQLTNVILFDVDADKTGVASGTNTTVRQVGLALGIAVFASFLNALTIRHATSSLRAAHLDSFVETVRTRGVSFSPPPGVTPADASTLRHVVDSAIAAGARPAMLFAATVVAAGFTLSFLIPRVVIVSAEPEVSSTRCSDSSESAPVPP
jgi:hypothetical protein